MQRGKNWLGEEGILWLTRARETTGSLKCSLLQYKAGEANNDSYLKKVMCTLYFAVVVMDFVRTVRSITSYSWISQWFFSFFGVAVFPLSARGRVPYGAVRQSFPGRNAALRATDGLQQLVAPGQHSLKTGTGSSSQDLIVCPTSLNPQPNRRQIWASSNGTHGILGRNHELTVKLLTFIFLDSK